MFGRVISESIAVDCFEDVTKNGIYFLSEPMLTGPLPPHVDRVYTSSHNIWILRTKYKVDQNKLVGMPLNQQFLIQDKVKKLDFNVTLLDAKQKPGAVMFIFEGEDIGKVVYAGRCCYTDSCFSKPLTNFLKVKLVDRLYVHAACDDCQSHSVSTSAAVDDIINIVRWNPTCKIVINEPFFREDILKDLKEKLRKPISVSENIMRHLEELGLGSDFQLDRSTAQVYITDRSIRKVYFSQPVFKIILTPCPMKLSSKKLQDKLYQLEKKGYHVILYRNHCSPQELVNFARCINAKHTVLLRPLSKGRHPSQRPKDFTYWSHLGDFQRIIDFLDNFDEKTRTTTAEDLVDVEMLDVCEELPEKTSTTPRRESIQDVEEIPQDSFVIESDAGSVVSQETAVNTRVKKSRG